MAKKTKAKEVYAPDMAYMVNRDGTCSLVLEDYDARKLPEEIAKAICDKYHGYTK